MNLTEEILLKEGKMLPVMEHFYTLQGEGQLTQEKLLISSD
jgi:7-carboxy-7-deazaguanine synthase